MSKSRLPHSAGVKHVFYLLLLMLFSHNGAISQTSIFTSQTPVAATDNDHKPTVGQELGVKFTSSAAGTITGIRFYKTSGNAGTHTGELYAANGTRLAQATFVNETATGWQTVSFATPVAITANTSYTAAYFSSLGNYTEDNDYFKGHAVTNSPLTAPADGTNGGNGTDPGNGQGVYAYTSSPAFPNQLYRSANYWVDVIYSNASGVVANAGADQTQTYPSGSLYLNGDLSTGNITNYAWILISGPNTPIIVSPTEVSTQVTGIIQGVYKFQLSLNGGVSKAQVTYTVKYIPPSASAGSDEVLVSPYSAVTIGSYSTAILAGTDTAFLWKQISGPNTASFTNIKRVNPEVYGLIQGVYVFQQYAYGAGAPGVDSARISVTVLPPGLSPNIFTTQTPAVTLANAGGGIEVGVKFRSSEDGFITGVRFYKAAGNTGTHTGELYALDGTRLAQAVFTNETNAGWQTVSFSTPVAIKAYATYVASYFSSAGNFNVTTGYFKKSAINNPLTALSDGYNGPNDPNGVFNISPVPVFPIPPGVQSSNYNNYWVDVVFTNANGSLKADAGPNQEIYGPQTTISASASTGNITSYQWSFISVAAGFGPPATPVITSPNSPTTTISGLVPANGKYGDDEGYYTLQLSLNGGASVSQMNIHVLPSNAYAGPDQTITLPANSVTLDGSLSSGINKSYKWTQVTGPNTAAITTPTAITTTATGLIQGVYLFQLTLNGGFDSSQVHVIVNAGVTTISTGIFTTQTPVATTDNDHQPAAGQEVGVKFTSSSAGQITGLRFYKTTGNAGVHTGELYSANGTRLAQVVFINETASGWQTVALSTPVTITANTTYTAAYFSSLGNYTEDNDYFLHHAVTNNSLTAPADGTNGASGTDPGTGQGVFKYSSSPTFPNQLFRSANYWVDVVFSSGGAVVVANAGPDQYISLPTSVITLNASVSTGTITSYKWTQLSGPNISAITSAASASTTVSGLIAGNYVFTLSLNGGASNAIVNVTVYPQPAIVTNAGADQTITLPVNSVTLDGSKSTTTGTFSFIFWSLVSSTNTTNVPVITNPNSLTTTVTGLGAGTYTFSLNLETQPADEGESSEVTITVNPSVTTAVANAGPNQTVTLPVTSVTLNGSGSTGPITSYSWQLLGLGNTIQEPVIKNPNSAITTVTGLTAGTYTFGLSVNNIIPDATVVITVNTPANGSTIFTTQTPVAGTDNDHQPSVGQEVGIKFNSASTGFITGIRFYKTSGNTGTHIGELYGPDGARLAQATFTNETVTGWQIVTFSTPVPITIHTTYTAAYFSSLGNYTEENDYFLHHSITNLPLFANEDGTNGGTGTDPGIGQGVYKYTSSPAFPNQLYRSANYWVDVIFNSNNTVNASPKNEENAKAVDEAPTDSVIKQNYFLGQNYPNPVPMSQSTKIEYSVPVSTQVSLILYDMQGKPVKILVNELKNAGRYSYDLNTGTLAKGLYVYSMHAGNFYDVKKLVVQ
jgi:hypothetical protein